MDEGVRKYVRRKNAWYLVCTRGRSDLTVLKFRRGCSPAPTPLKRDMPKSSPRSGRRACRRRASYTRQVFLPLAFHIHARTDVRGGAVASRESCDE
jgi:hypothetical protein